MISGIIGGNMKKTVYKPPNGKLLRIRFEEEDDVIKNLRITGDFFIHPEEAIVDIEEFLIGKRINVIESALKKFLLENDIIVIGFKPIDLLAALSKDGK